MFSLAHTGPHGQQIFLDRQVHSVAGFHYGKDRGNLWAGLGAPTCSQFLRPRATGRMEFSATLLDSSPSE